MVHNLHADILTLSGVIWGIKMRLGEDLPTLASKGTTWEYNHSELADGCDNALKDILFQSFTAIGG
jgi:hypothetical protein